MVTYSTLSPPLDHLLAPLEAIREEGSRRLGEPRWREVQTLFQLLPKTSLQVGCEEGVVTLGETQSLSAEVDQTAQKLLKNLQPWRKGPFSLGGIKVDAEWRSDMKWERIKEFISGERLLDVGCGNGYSLFRALERGVKTVVGFEPYERYFFQYALLKHFAPDLPIWFEPAGYEECFLVRNSFDTTLCLGVVYHHRDPLRVLEACAASLRAGGQLIVESIAIPGGESHALFPPERYARMKNVYFIPTPPCLLSWMNRIGLKKVELVHETPLTTDEQRPTPLSPGASLASFLSEDRFHTIEGHPAPLRIVARGFRG